jgi:hypothetical protein
MRHFLLTVFATVLVGCERPTPAPQPAEGEGEAPVAPGTFDGKDYTTAYISAAAFSPDAKTLLAADVAIPFSLKGAPGIKFVVSYGYSVAYGPRRCCRR